MLITGTNNGGSRFVWTAGAIAGVTIAGMAWLLVHLWVPHLRTVSRRQMCSSNINTSILYCKERKHRLPHVVIMFCP